ncbi:MAG: hypothetical protein NC117_10460 [Pseudoflavonifractor sp.]|nr:hypothetical protein [Pseudoflavonifractor sp.]
MIAAVTPLGLGARGLSALTERLATDDCYRANVRYTVMMVMSRDDISYDLTLYSLATASDPLSPCDYLIDWSLPTPSGLSTGFSAYFDGHAYSYRNERLREYHYTWDSIPFMPKGTPPRVVPGVQRTAQFTSLLPQYIAEELTKAVSDSAYSVTFTPDTVIDGSRRIAVTTRRTAGTTTGSESLYIFDRETMLPVYIEIENNPGTIGEQTLTASYSYDTADNSCRPLTEQYLIDRYPDPFGRYRESNFSISNFPGSQLPGFSLPTTTGERYTRRRDEPFRAPTLVALIDPVTGFAPAVVSAIRDAVDAMPATVDVIWAFTSNNLDEIDSVVTSPREGEHLLMSARGLARDCGAASLPVILIVDSSGKVRDTIIGFNKTLSTDVMQKTAAILGH